jgi:hypothetical protein
MRRIKVVFKDGTEKVFENNTAARGLLSAVCAPGWVSVTDSWRLTTSYPSDTVVCVVEDPLPGRW